MKTSKALKEERALKLQEFEGLAKKGESATPEELQRADALASEIESLTVQVENAERRERTAALAAEMGSGGNQHSPSVEKDLRKLSIAKGVAESRNGKLTGVEKEFIEQYADERRQMRVSDGGFYIPAEFIRYGKPESEKRAAFTIGNEGADVMQTTLGQVIPFLQPQPIVEALGATMVSGLSGDFQLPVFTNNAAISAYTETGDITDTTIQTSNKKLSPKRYGGEIQWSVQAGIQASFALENTLRQMLNRALAIAVDSESLNGSGSSNRVTGLLNYSGVGAVVMGTNGAAPTWAKILEFQSDVQIANAADGSMSFIVTPALLSKLMSTPKQSSGVEGNFIVNNPETLLGYGLQATNQLPSNLTKGTGSNLSAMIFGDWTKLWVGTFGGVNLIFDDITIRRGGKQALIIEQFFDVQVEQAGAFSVSVDMVTT
jgi:HK97 family phage major capsid protein